MDPSSSHPILLRMIRQVTARTSLLRTGAAVYPVLEEDASTRYGRVLAAQLASLGLRRHLWFAYGGTHLGPAGLLVNRRPDPVDELHPDERVLLDLLFAGAGSARVAQARSGRAWDDLALTVRRGASAEGLGWLRRERRRYCREVVGVREAMRRYKSAHPPWEGDPELHRAGVPLAVLFGIDSGIPHWPPPPDEEMFLPSMLPVACQMSLVDSL